MTYKSSYNMRDHEKLQSPLFKVNPVKHVRQFPFVTSNVLHRGFAAMQVLFER